MSDKTEKKELTILRLLQKAEKPLSSSGILERLQAMGQEVSERTIRYYFKILDEKGLTESLGKKGRVITPRGQKELSKARVFDKVGFLETKIDQLTYRMTFDLAGKKGTVVVNISLIDRDVLVRAAPMICKVYAAGYSMGSMMCLFKSGERVGDIVIPPGMAGFGTVCSITLNGILLAHGIPVHSSFGGLLELHHRKPVRFVEIIKYSGTSLDPLEVFIRSGMTDYAGAISKGNGRIGVGFREVPADSRDRVIGLIEKLKEAGLGGFLLVGWPGQPLLQIPVPEGRAGIVVIGGLNPVAILEETGTRIQSRAMAGMVEYERLFHYRQMEERIRGMD
ncbi:MAG: NrpR regulatory domain-containing protein [Desulfobulbaceae bacterium]|nr:NrpR regulatory domain-containing protein [Desulfobulbaceae bacterium]